jgi:branched-chain amino acid transport system ATP-binding protein
MGLSPKLTTEVFRDIRRIADGGRTVMLVEQNAYAALGIADYGYVLEGGRVALAGPADQLANDDYVRQAYLGA